MKSIKATGDRLSFLHDQGSQETGQPRSILDPLLLAILGTAFGLAVLVVGVAIFWGSGPVIAEIPWFIPMVASFISLAGLCVAFLAFGRYQVLRDPVSFWVGLGFASLGIGQLFYVLAWPGLLPDGGAIIASLPNTPALITNLNLTIFSGLMLVAVLIHWPGKQTLLRGRWLVVVSAWLFFFTLILILIVSYEQYLPVFVRADGTFTPLLRGLVAFLLLLFAAGSILSTRYYLRSGDALAGYIAFAQMALVFLLLMTIIGGKRYDLWWYLQRVIGAGGYLVVLLGLLSEYVRLLRRESEGRLMLRAVMENVPIGLAITGGPPDFPLAKVSRHGLEMNQRPAEGLVGLPSGQHQEAWRIFLPDGVTQPLPEQMPLYRASRLGVVTRNLELVMEARDGRKIPVLVSAAPIRDAQGKIVAAINTWLDITERKRAEAALQKRTVELERANRDLQNFTVMTSHDLQEPLRKIEALGDTVLISASGLDEDLFDRIQRMRKSAQQMRKMVDGLLQLALLSTDPPSFQPVDMYQIAMDILSEKKEQIQQLGGVVEVSELPVIEADPLQMRRLLQHLVENALKFQPPGGKPRITVSCKQLASGSVRILIEDNGIGFDDAYAGYLFEPFERLVGKNQPQYDGVGMGLAICRWIVERHGGKITAGSKSGQGASFIVTLPIRHRIGLRN